MYSDAAWRGRDELRRMRNGLGLGRVRVRRVGGIMVLGAKTLGWLWNGWRLGRVWLRRVGGILVLGAGTLGILWEASILRNVLTGALGRRVMAGGDSGRSTDPSTKVSIDSSHECSEWVHEHRGVGVVLCVRRRCAGIGEDLVG